MKPPALAAGLGHRTDRAIAGAAAASPMRGGMHGRSHRVAAAAALVATTRILATRVAAARVAAARYVAAALLADVAAAIAVAFHIAASLTCDRPEIHLGMKRSGEPQPQGFTLRRDLIGEVEVQGIAVEQRLGVDQNRPRQPGPFQVLLARAKRGIAPHAEDGQVSIVGRHEGSHDVSGLLARGHLDRRQDFAHLHTAFGLADHLCQPWIFGIAGHCKRTYAPQYPDSNQKLLGHSRVFPSHGRRRNRSRLVMIGHPRASLSDRRPALACLGAGMFCPPGLCEFVDYIGKLL